MWSGLPLRDSATITAEVPNSGSYGPVRAEEFSIVALFDVDWLLESRFAGLLDNMAASPGAHRTVRFFGSLRAIRSLSRINAIHQLREGGTNPGAA